MIGAERVKRAAPDGYTIGVLNDSILTMIPNVRPVPYDPLKDFTPIGVVAGITWVLVANNDLPVKTVADLVTLAKSRPGRIDYSSGGVGSPQHVAMEAFKAETGIYLVHIPYRGATQAALDVISNQVQVHLGAVSIVQPYINSGRVRALGVPSAKRSPLLPNVPTMAEAGVSGFEWQTCRAPERGARKSDRLARRARQADRAGPRADRLAAGDGDEVDAGRPEAHARRRRSRRNQARVVARAE
jgi:tripartite-type tricarboxylate transporter receptor subunit TctC